MVMSNANDDNEEKLLRYMKCLDALRKEDSQYIRMLLQAFNFGRTPKDKRPRHFQELAVLMVENESDLERVIRYAKKLLPPKTLASFLVGVGVAQEAALVKEFMHPLPDASLFPPTATVAELNQFFMRAEILRYFVVKQEGTGELLGMLSVSDYLPNRSAIEGMGHDALVTSLRYFRREVESLKETDTMDLAQQKFEEHPKLTYLFVVDEARHPKGLLSKNEDLERWRTSRSG